MSVSSPIHVNREGHEGFPWKHVIGFLLSLVLTFIALWLVVSVRLPAGALITMIVFLAALQVLVQLLFFMHIGEGYRPIYHIGTLLFAFFTVFIVVAASIWIMAFTSMPSIVS